MKDSREDVKEYYSKMTVENEGQMATQVCSLAGQGLPRSIKKIRSGIPKEVIDRYYGCGSPIPSVLEGQTVLDLGCGTGVDVYTLSKLVGESGHVVGVDMNEDQLAIAEKYQEKMTRKYKFDQPNTTFKKAYIEDLKAAGIKDESVDIVVSNCVLNLSPDKEAVFKEIWRVLKPGGELYFADIFAGRRVPESVSQDPVLRGECLGGAIYIGDFHRLMAQVGWSDLRVMASRPAPIGNGRIEELVGNIDFYSVTYRTFKLPELLEDGCEDYGQIAIYKGGIADQSHLFELDRDHRFELNRPYRVCGNTAALLEETRFAPYFQVMGNRDQHFGPFIAGRSHSYFDPVEANKTR